LGRNPAKPSLTFDWGTAGCSASSCYLTGTLQLTDILQSGQGAVINLGLDANLTITGGSLAYPVGSIYDYTIDFSSRTGLNQLTEERLLKATGSSGEVLASTPKPNSEILLASGLQALLIGSVLRRRWQSAS
jgi:hypothetical protein